MQKSSSILKTILIVSLTANIFVVSLVLVRFLNQHDLITPHAFHQSDPEQQKKQTAFRKIWQQHKSSLRPKFQSLKKARQDLRKNLKNKSSEADLRQAFTQYQQDNLAAITDLSDMLITIALTLPEPQRAPFLMRWAKKKKPKHKTNAAPGK